MKTVTLTEEQAKIVMKALDISVRTGGLESAAIALPVAHEIEQQLQLTSTSVINPEQPKP